MLRVFTISPMYPNSSHPAFGGFIKHLEDNIQSNHRAQFIHGVRHDCGGSKLKRVLSYIAWAVRVVWIGLTERYDLIHAHTVYPAGPLAVILSMLRKKPLLITVHGSDICLIHDKNQIVQWLSRLALDKSCMIQAVSQYIKGRIEDFYCLGTKKIFVQCMGVDTSIFKPSPDTIVSRENKNLIFIGNLVEKKGWENAFCTVEQLISRGESCTLDVYGDGPDKIAADEWIASHELSSAIFLHGSQPHSVIKRALQTADLFLFPTKYEEAFSLVTAEALACNVPVVVSSKGALPELIANCPGSVAMAVDDYENIQSLANACQKILDQQHNHSRSKREPFLNSSYSLDNTTRKMLDVFQKMGRGNLK